MLHLQPNLVDNESLGNSAFAALELRDTLSCVAIRGASFSLLRRLTVSNVDNMLLVEKEIFY